MKSLNNVMHVQIIALLFIIFIVASVTGQYYRGDRCRYGRQRGRCVLFSRCPFALQQYEKNIRPEICGFEGREPVVCCPRTTGNISNPPPTVAPIVAAPGLKSNEKCQEYTKSTGAKIHPITAIVGGLPASIKEFPHMAALGFGDENDIQWQCGGTLISEEFVLTAGHCLYSQQLGDVSYVRLGDFNLKEDADDAAPQTFRVASVYKNPSYKPPSQYNDIALIKLDRPAEITAYVKPACLQTEYALPEGFAPIATGWGRLGFTGESSDQLMKVTLSYFANDQCRQVYSSTSQLRLPNGIVDDTQVCAGGINTSTDTCQGDSGGPLQIKNGTNPNRYYIIGVTSFGKGCGIENIPGVYTRVSNYIDWIEQTVWPDS